jgi:HAD superfamily hydrolase (TIGR01549 family)
MQTRNVFLDAFGTLVSLDPPAPRLQAALSSRLGVRVSEADAQRAIAAEIAYYRAHFDEGRDAASLASLRARCGEVIRSALAGQLGAVENGALAEVLMRSLRFTAFPDAVPFLQAARSAGVRLTVVSNWDVSLHDVLERLELAPLLDGILTSAEAGARKPARAIFEQALALARASAADTIHVGDSVPDDVGGARAAGIEPVLIRRDGGPGPSGVRTIATLGELQARSLT